MGFILKVYILGLVAFLPSPDGTEMNVLLVDARDGYALSDGTWMERHEPLLLARSAECRGDCRDGFQAVADYFYQADPAENVRLLEAAIGGGATWPLDGSEISIRIPEAEGSRAAAGLTIQGRDSAPGQARSAVTPPTGRAPGAFDWVAAIGQLQAGTEAIDPDVLAERPEKGLIVGRLTLGTGHIGTERLVTLEDEVVALSFRPLRHEDGSDRDTRALADQVVVEIPVAGCEIALEEDRFNGAPGRSITLAPESCTGGEVVEVVLMNLPHDSFVPEVMAEHREEIGKHFEMFYELAYLRPPNHLRPVPFPSARLEAMTREVRGERSAGPRLLPALGLPARGAHSRPICPMAQFQSLPETTIE